MLMALGVFLAGLVVCVAAGLGILCHPFWLVWFIQQRQPHIIYHVPMKQKYVALTLDDGPQSNITPTLLEVLKKNDSRATWFIIGNHMNACPSVVERIYKEGHEVGNHTMADVPSWRLSKEVFEDQLVNVDMLINPYFRKDSSGKTLKWFRPGHGFYNSSIVSTCEKHGYQIALGSLFPMDHMFQNQAKRIVANMLWRMHPGAVIVLHDRAQQQKQTPQVLELLLPELRNRGYKIVTLSELVQIGAWESAQLNSRCLWRGMVGMMHREMCNSIGRTRAFWKVLQRVALGIGRSLRVLVALGGVLSAFNGVSVAIGPNVWPSISGISSSTSNTSSATTNETGSALGTHTTKHVHTLYFHGGRCQG